MSWTKNNDWLKEPQSDIYWKQLKRFARHYKGLEGRFAIAIVLSLFSAASLLLVPQLLRKLQVAISQEHLHDAILPVIVLAVVLTCQPITASLVRLLRVSIASRLNYSLTERFQRKLLAVPLQVYLAFERRTSVYQRVIDATNITNQLTDVALTTVQQFATASATLLIIFTLNVSSGLILLAGYLVCTPLFVITARRLQAKRTAVLAVNFPLVSKLLEFLKRLTIVKILGAHTQITGDIVQLLERKVIAEQAEGRVECAGQSLAALVSAVILVASLLLALSAVYSGKLPVANVISMYILLSISLGALSDLAKSYLALVSLSSNVRNYEEVLALAEEGDSFKSHLTLSGPSHPLSPEASWHTATVDLFKDRIAIAFKDVHFGYDTGTPVLRGASFSIKHGEHVALIGRSGSGKSTIMRLLLGLIDVEYGSIYVEASRESQATTLLAHRRRFGVVTQDATLFEISVRENLLLGGGLPPATDDSAVWAALDQVCLADRIRAFPRALDEVCNDELFSGGERQRLTIARVLLRDPEIVILDEPTSALDFESEMKVLSAISSLTLGRTTITIAHRLSTVRAAERVIVLENGMVRATGSHDALLVEDDYYRSLCGFNTFIL